MLRFVIKINEVDAATDQKVSRVKFSDTSNETKVHGAMDINVDIFPIFVGQVYEFALIDDIMLPLDKHFGEETISRKDYYDYIMFGRIFEVETDETETTVTMSCGGLLLQLSGVRTSIGRFCPLDKKLYLGLKFKE